jgi:mono/diheme cytochrome c family protein
MMLNEKSPQMGAQVSFWQVTTVLALVCGALPAFAADVFAGRTIYAAHCEGCHGDEGHSFEPGVPDFSNGDALFQTDTELFSKIRGGAGTMPAYRGVLSDSEVRNVIAYLRSLQK